MTMDNGGRRTPQETARYLELMTREMRSLAGEAGYDFLAYLFAMAEDEAANIVKGTSSGKSGRS